MQHILPVTKARYIKLGRGGKWEKECIEKGGLRFGYESTPHEWCVQGDWGAVHDFWLKARKGKKQTASRDRNQIRAFYEADQSHLFITFYDDCLYWCRPAPGVRLLTDNTRWRDTLNGWHNTSMGGTMLSKSRLSGALIRTQMFQGTICDISKTYNYLYRKLTDTELPQVKRARLARDEMENAALDLIRLLTWQDFEFLVEHIFANTRWQRLDVVGKTQKTIDLALVDPITEENAFVQIKASASQATLEAYTIALSDSHLYSTMFFAWHSGSLSENQDVNNVHLLGPRSVARAVVNGGLLGWLIDKTS